MGTRQLVDAEASKKANDAKWRQTDHGIVLLGGKCTACGLKIFPFKPYCPGCGADKSEQVELSRKGSLYSYSTIHIAPSGLTTPYTVGLVDLDDGVRVFAQIEGAPGSFKLDEAVEPTIGAIRTEASGVVEGYKFRRAC